MVGIRNNVQEKCSNHDRLDTDQYNALNARIRYRNARDIFFRREALYGDPYRYGAREVDMFQPVKGTSPQQWLATTRTL